MDSELRAVIFDMDGVLINSEHLWRKAMIQGFGEAGMILTEQECRQTMGMRFREVIALWLEKFKLTNLSVTSIEDRVLDLLIHLIKAEGAFIPGVENIVEYCKIHSIRMGLATSSSEILMHAVLNKLNLSAALNAIVSAEHMQYGKPHPEVFLRCADILQVLPQHCLVLEDSLNGVIAAKAAQMQVIAVPDDDHFDIKQFVLADYKCKNMQEALNIVKQKFPKIADNTLSPVQSKNQK